jgi:hypothetical protein
MYRRLRMLARAILKLTRRGSINSEYVRWANGRQIPGNTLVTAPDKVPSR